MSWFTQRRAVSPPLPAIHPDPELLRKLRNLELRTRGFVESLFSGEYPSVFHGRGSELSHVRAYQPGDDVRAIDWKVTARRATPYVRQFIEERDLLVVLVVDVSASSRLGPGSRSASEVAAELAAALCFAAQRNNDRVALLLVSDRVESFVPPRSGRNHALRLLAEVVTHVPRHHGTDLSAGLERVARSFRARASVFLISDFIQGSATDRLGPALASVARVHQTVAIRLDTVSAVTLPDVGWMEVRDPESGRRVLVDSGSRRVRDSYRRRVQEAQAETARKLTGMGVELVDVALDGDPVASLAEFFRRRQRASR